MTLLTTICIGIPLIISIALFYIKTSGKILWVRIILYFGRSIMVFITLIFILFFFFTKEFGIIFDPFDNYHPNENTSPVPTVSFSDLKKVVSLSEKYKIRFIEKTGTGYSFYGENGVPLMGIQDDDISTILIQNNISYVDNYLDFYTDFEIIDSNRIFTLEKKGIGNLKKGDITNGGKVNRILNDRWILLDKCSRNNCPELNK